MILPETQTSVGSLPKHTAANGPADIRKRKSPPKTHATRKSHNGKRLAPILEAKARLELMVRKPGAKKTLQALIVEHGRQKFLQHLAL